MANKDNELKNLKWENEEAEQWSEIFDMQKELQIRLGFDFTKMSTYEVAKFCMENKHAFDDEFGEMMDALGGEDLGNAAWKHWKKKNEIARQRRISQLSEGDMIELKYEFIDMLHFFINFGLAIGITGEEVYNMYKAKNRENHKRQDRNY